MQQQLRSRRQRGLRPAGLNTGTIEAGAVATATFTVPEGTTEFVCTFHSGMTGTIEGV